jgi:hypothetical protein
MRYLFYNIYGDAQYLLDTKPEDVVATPFGWDEQTEANRNAMLQSLNVNTSCLPAVFVWLEDKEKLDIDGNPYTVLAHWHEIRIFDMEKPWNWEDIENEENRIKTV